MGRLRRAALVLLVVGASMCMQPLSGAQGSPPVVQLTGIEDDAFPLITLYARIVDQQGVPVPALDEDSIRIVEGGGAAIAPDAVAGETTRPLALVLALDLSVSTEDWQVVQGAVEDVLAACGERDEVGLVAFADQAETLAAFGSPDEARRAVRDLEPGGDYTDLHSAVLRATDLAAKSSLARSAVLVLTDSWDNRESEILADTLSQLKRRRVPVHVIGVGAKMAQAESQQLVSIAQATGGLAYRMADASQLGETLDGLNLMLRHEYKVTYHSPRAADGEQQDVRLEVTAAGRQGKAEGTFTARSRDLVVSVSGVTEGERVSGALPLSVQIDGSAGGIREVAYWLDGELVHTSTEAPFAFTWNSARVALGAHTLAAEARDAAGNSGAAEVQVEVVVPIAIGEIRLPGTVELGKPVPIEAEVHSEVALDTVTVLLDGRPAGSAEPGEALGRYQLTFDSSAWGGGEHVVTVQARDVLGRSVEKTRSVRFLLPPTPVPTPTPVPVETPRQLRLGDAIAILTAAASIVGTVLLTVSIARAQRRRQRRALAVELQNQGNVRSRYDLRADDPGQALIFGWEADGAPLGRRQLAERIDVEPPARHQPVLEPKQPALPNGTGSLQRVQEGTSAAMRSSGGLASLLNGIASLLPRSAQAPLRRISRQIGRGRSTVGQARTASSRATRLARRAKSAKRQEREPQPRVSRSPWSQTSFVEPGQTLTVKLLVDPAQPYRAQQRTFHVYSRSVEQEDAPVTVDEQVLLIPGVSWFRRWSPFALLYVTAAAVTLVVYWLVRAGVPGV
jgi:hypothetical protein